MAPRVGPYADTDHDIEELVQNAMGDSVTPSRLLDLTEKSRISRFLSGNPPNPIEWIAPDEQPHYILLQSGALSITSEEAEADSIFDDEFDTTTRGNGTDVNHPCILVLTDRRSLLIYGDESDAADISISFDSIGFVESTTMMTLPQLNIHTSNFVYNFSMFPTRPYASELSDVVAYLTDNVDEDEEYATYDFADQDYSGAKKALLNQLERMGDMFKDVDKKYVVKQGAKGASYCSRGGPKVTGIGFALFAGHALYVEVQDTLSREDASMNPENLDPQKTAEIVNAYQVASRETGGPKVDLASQIIGTAVAIDEQMPGPNKVPRLPEADIDKVRRQLEEGNKEDLLHTAAMGIVNYSDEIDEVLSGKYFNRIG